MIEAGCECRIFAVNTDAQDLKMSKADNQIGMNLTKGLGAGAKRYWSGGHDESINEIVNYIQGIWYLLHQVWVEELAKTSRHCKSCKRNEYSYNGSNYITFFLEA